MTWGVFCYTCPVTKQSDSDWRRDLKFEEKRLAIMPLRYALALAGIVFLSLVGGRQSALAENRQDYCVKCVNPDQTYICRIISNSAQTQGKQFLCIINIAKEQGHDSCTATAQSLSCSGILVQYEISGSPAPQTSADNIAATVKPTTPAQTKGHQDDEPRTLVEFTKQATKATKNNIKSAGKNTGKAIKKTGKKITKFTSKVGRNIEKATKTTLKCITSLFSSCSSD
jgi:hypothetical protein